MHLMRDALNATDDANLRRLAGYMRIDTELPREELICAIIEAQQEIASQLELQVQPHYG